MKQILAAILSALLCVQPVFAMPVKEPVLYTDAQGEAEDNDETQKNSNTQEPAEGQEAADTKDSAGGRPPAAQGMRLAPRSALHPQS